MVALQEVWNTESVYKNLVWNFGSISEGRIKRHLSIGLVVSKGSCEGWRNAAEVHGKGKQNESIVNQLCTHAITIIPAL